MIPDRTSPLQRLHLEHIAHAGEGSETNGHRSYADAMLSDEKVIELCRSAKNAPKFERLFDQGDTGEYGHDDSRTDQALVSLMAFYTQSPEQLDRLVRDSALHRPEKWGRRSDYRRRTIEKALEGLRETYSPPNGTGPHLSKNGHQKPASPSPSLYKGSGRRDDKSEGPIAVRFVDMKLPGPRRYLLDEFVPAPYVTLLHGDGGVAKSMLALAFAVAVSGGSGTWLGRRVENGPALYLDFELDADEQARRGLQLCRGAGLSRPPEGLLYMSALGHTAREGFDAALEACEKHSVKLMVLDSLGPALQGDAEASRDVIGFFQAVIEPFRAAGVPS